VSGQPLLHSVREGRALLEERLRRLRGSAPRGFFGGRGRRGSIGELGEGGEVVIEGSAVGGRPVGGEEGGVSLGEREELSFVRGEEGESVGSVGEGSGGRRRRRRLSLRGLLGRHGDDESG